MVAVSMKGLIATGIFLALILAYVWITVAIYPQVSEEQIRQVYLRNDWYAALGRGDFAQAERIQTERGK